MSLEEYLGKKGVDSPVSDYNLDKLRLPHGETARQRDQRIKAAVAAQNEYAARRSAAIQEYQEKVERGEIVPKTTLERMLKTAHGHPDNPSVQAAARRVLTKRGIDWQTGEPLPHKEYAISTEVVHQTNDLAQSRVQEEDQELEL